MSKHIEVIFALAASALGLIGLGFAVFGPTTYSYPPPGDVITAGSSNLWSYGLNTTAIVTFLAVMLVATLGVSLGAYLESLGERAIGLFTSWASAIALTVGAAVTFPGESTTVVPSQLATSIPDSVGIGVYLVPAAVAAIVAAIVASVVHHEPTRTGMLTQS